MQICHIAALHHSPERMRFNEKYPKIDLIIALGYNRFKRMFSIVSIGLVDSYLFEVESFISHILTLPAEHFDPNIA